MNRCEICGANHTTPHNALVIIDLALPYSEIDLTERILEQAEALGIYVADLQAEVYEWVEETKNDSCDYFLAEFLQSIGETVDERISEAGYYPVWYSESQSYIIFE